MKAIALDCFIHDSDSDPDHIRATVRCMVTADYPADYVGRVLDRHASSSIFSQEEIRTLLSITVEFGYNKLFKMLFKRLEHDLKDADVDAIAMDICKRCRAKELGKKMWSNRMDADALWRYIRFINVTTGTIKGDDYYMTFAIDIIELLLQNGADADLLLIYGCRDDKKDVFELPRCECSHPKRRTVLPSQSR
jgi:hypothetical protein